MTEAKSLLEKIWWVIPPVVVALITLSVTPLVMTVLEYLRNPSYLFFSVYAVYVGSFLFFLFSFWGMIVILSTIAFMGIGYYLSRKKSVTIRIVVPIITALVGHYIPFMVYIWHALT